MPTADQVYVDPSALSCLYLHQQERSRRMVAWRRRVDGGLFVTHHGKTEIINALCRARFAGEMNDEGLGEALADLDQDFAEGRLRQADILWRAALTTAAVLSREHTPRLGTRCADVLHVACALELKLRLFLTFDRRQQKLAAVCGLKLIRA